MKKLNLKLLTALVAVVLVAGMTIFYACKKEETPTNKPPVENNEKSYEDYVKELIATTGIDIHALSKFKEIKNISCNYSQIDAAINSRAPINDATVLQINQLKNAIEIAAINEDYNTFFILFEQLCTLSNSLNGVTFITNEDGFQIIEYDYDEYLYPKYHLAANAKAVNDIITTITENYPVFTNLPENTQQEVLASALYLNFLEEDEDNPLLVPKSCSGVKAELVVRLTAYTAAYVLTAGLCTGTAFAIFLCEGLAYAGYVDACASAILSYKADMKNCQ